MHWFNDSAKLRTLEHFRNVKISPVMLLSTRSVLLKLRGWWEPFASVLETLSVLLARCSQQKNNSYRNPLVDFSSTDRAENLNFRVSGVQLSSDFEIISHKQQSLLLLFTYLLLHLLTCVFAEPLHTPENM